MEDQKWSENKTDPDQKCAATTERMIEICFIFVIKETKTYKISMNFKFPLD